MHAPDTLALVICTYRRPQALVRLLEAVGSQTRVPDEVLIVDGSPDQDSEEAVAPFLHADASAVRYRRATAEERGLTRQRNVGIAETTATMIAFLDDDTVPEPRYFEAILACFSAHPDAIGVGGFLTETTWQHTSDDIEPRGEDTVLAVPGGTSGGLYRQGPWSRPEGLRWRLRTRLGLASPLPPGWMPPSGHGRSLGYLPPDGQDHPVEFIMGGASTWRRSLFDQASFSRYFEGYGLYEDLDFCLRVRHRGPLFLCTQARVAHLHEPLGRPRPWHYGRMVTRNGWRVWRTRWPQPSWPDRARWWSTTFLLAGCRLGEAIRGPRRGHALLETLGRLAGGAEVLMHPPPREESPLEEPSRV